MKIRYLIVSLLALAFTLTGCKKTSENASLSTKDNTIGTTTSAIPTDKGSETTTKKNTHVRIENKVDEITINHDEVETFDLPSLFDVFFHDELIDLSADYIETDLEPIEGTYTVTLKYMGEESSITVNVHYVEYILDLTETEIEISKVLVGETDFKSYFMATKDGEQESITDDMVTTDLIAEEGEYSYTVSYKGIMKTLKVIVINTHDIEIYKAYNSIEVYENELSNIDFKKYFMLYVDGNIERVEDEYISGFDKDSYELNKEYKIKLEYELDKSYNRSEISFTVKPDLEVTITAKDITIYPNCSPIDVTTLFEIKKGDSIVPVLNEYINGEINYSSLNDSVLTLTYEGKTAIATVKVKEGVVLGYRKSSVINIAKGTNKEFYDFASDFIFTINGHEFAEINPEYINLGNVDFNTIGSYDVTLSVPYRNMASENSTEFFDTTSLTITYNVVEKEYDYFLRNEKVDYEIGDEFDPTSNISLRINGIRQTFTRVDIYEDAMTCYFELKDSINLDEPGLKTITLLLYVYGHDKEPIEVSYGVNVLSSIRIETIKKIAFEGDTIYRKDLFKVYDGEESIEIDESMIEGYIDCYKEGTYTVSINYQGVKAETKVIIYSKAIVSKYLTSLRTLGDEKQEDEEGYITEGTSSSSINPFYIKDDFTLRFGSRSMEVIDAIDEHTLIINIATNTFTMIIDNGILVLIPENRYNLAYTDERRPLVFFSENMYEIGERYVVSYGSDYVLNNIITNYSIDCLSYIDKMNGETKWYGLYTDLVERTSNDTFYVLKYGPIEFDESFTVESEESYLIMDGKRYDFTLIDANKAKIKEAQKCDGTYSNLEFTGMIDGVLHSLKFDKYENLSLYNGTKRIMDINHGGELSTLTYGGFDYVNNVVYVYTPYGLKNEYGFYSYKFVLNLENNTFEAMEKDKYFGVYKNGDILFFIDGHGHGYAQYDNSYNKTDFTYKASNGEIRIVYENIKPNFKYGTYVDFYIEDILNVITVKSSDYSEIVGLEYSNEKITNGALIDFSTKTFQKSTKTTFQRTLLQAISYETSAGKLSLTQLNKLVDISLVDYSKSGFYQIKIKVDVCGNEVYKTYGIEIVDDKYLNNPVVNTYKMGFINGYELTIDKFGMMKITINGVILSGYVKINDDYTLYGLLKATNGHKIVVSGKLLATGVLEIKASGSYLFSDYFVTGTYQASGTNGFIIRKIVNSTGDVYLLQSSKESLATLVNVTLIQDNIYKVENGKEITYIKVLSWSSTTEGLIKSSNLDDLLQ